MSEFAALDVWLCHLADAGVHPAVILEGPADDGRILIVPITSNADLEPIAAHRIALEREDDDFVQSGLWKSPSYICPLMTRYVRRSDLIERRGYLGEFYEELFVETLSSEAVKAKVRASIEANSQ